MATITSIGRERKTMCIAVFVAKYKINILGHFYLLFGQLAIAQLNRHLCLGNGGKSAGMLRLSF